MKEDLRFKPLWMIHNRTYRRYARGCTVKRFRRYWSKLARLARLVLRPIAAKLHR